MHRSRWMIALICATLLVLSVASTSLAQGTTYTVKAGDTLSGIAQRHGVTLVALADANGLTTSAWVYVGQTLTIPSGGSNGTGSASSGASSSASATTVYTVQLGDTLYGIAIRHGTTVAAIKAVNGLSSDTIYVGQRLTIPSGSSASAATAPPPPYSPYKGEKWIDVNLTYQTVTAYEGATAIYRTLASTGLPQTPTVTGTYAIYVKYLATDMEGGSVSKGDYYYLEDVPYTMYFYRGYGIHGTYWHNNFGQPMSHGCVNLSTPDAKWFYEWAPLGAKVVTHY